MMERESNAGAGVPGASRPHAPAHIDAPEQIPPSATLAHLRHELRTPLNQIIGFSDLLIEDADATCQIDLARDLRKINAAGKTLLALVGKVLDVAAPGTASAEEVTMKTASVEAPGVTRGPEARVPLQGASILVVDDEASNREILTRRLQRQGHAVTCAEDGEVALRSLASFASDLVLLDIMMPGMNGFDVLDRMKADERLRHIPVIVVSALDDLDSVVRCIEMGADDYLPKPVNTVLLEARVGASLEKKRLRDAERALYVELERSHALLKEVQQVRDDLTRLIVDDLRQPLTGFVVGIRSVLDMGPLNDDQRECLEMAADSGQKLVDMVSNLV